MGTQETSGATSASVTFRDLNGLFASPTPSPASCCPEHAGGTAAALGIAALRLLQQLPQLPPLLALPTALLEDVLLRLDCCSLGRCCAVSRAVRAAAGSGPLWAAQLQREFGLGAIVEPVGAVMGMRQPLAPSCVLPAMVESAPPVAATARGRQPKTTSGDAAPPRGDVAPPRGDVAPPRGDVGGSAAQLGPAEPSPSSLAVNPAGEVGAPACKSAQATFRRLVHCPLARHLVYLRHFDRLMAGVTGWSVRVSLLRRTGASLREDGGGGAGGGSGGGGAAEVLRSSVVRCRGVALNPQSAWLRFRLPGWVRRLAETGAGEQPPWEPGDTCGGSGGSPAGEDGKPYMELTVLAESLRGAAAERLGLWHGDAGPQSLVWPALHSSPFRLPQGDRMRLLQSHVEGLYIWDDDNDEEGAERDEARGEDDGVAVEGRAQEQEREQEETRNQQRRWRPPLGPHLAAYLHYEQLLPLCPPELKPLGGLPLALPPAPPHMEHLAGNGRHCSCAASLAARHEGQPAQQRAATSSPMPAAPHPSPGPALYLYLDWSVLPTATATEKEIAAAGMPPVGGGDRSSGWVAGCVVRLWLDRQSLEPGAVLRHPVQRVTGDSRRGDVVLLAPHLNPPPLGGMPASGEPAATAATASSGSTRGLGGGGGGGTVQDPEGSAFLERNLAALGGGRQGAAAQLAAAWRRAFGPGQPGAQDPQEFADGGEHVRSALAAVARAAPAAGMAAIAATNPNAVAGGPGISTAAAAVGAEAASRELQRRKAESLRLGAEAAMQLKSLLDGPAPLMVDLALLDPQREGEVRLGRCGVEMWSEGQDDHPGEDEGGGDSRVSLHFLLDQLPPRLQSLWDNRLTITWGVEGERGWGGGGAGGLEGSGPRAGGGAAVSSCAGALDLPLPWVCASLQMPLRSYELLTTATATSAEGGGGEGT